MDSRGAIIVFDGVCHLCNGWVKFLLPRDRAGTLRFAPMQSPRGRALLVEHGMSPDDPLSFLVVDADGAHQDSDAILRVVGSLGGAWRAVRVFAIVPRAWRDAAYRLVARNRYRWFGRADACAMPQPHWRERFLWD